MLQAVFKTRLVMCTFPDVLNIDNPDVTASQVGIPQRWVFMT